MTICDGFARDLSALYASSQADLLGIVAVANRHGARLEGDVGERELS